MSTYAEFLDAKLHLSGLAGFSPTVMPSWLFDFQSDLVDWATRKGRAAIFADCGLGKTPMQLVWAQNVIEHTNKPVLIVAPLAASAQTMREAAKFSIPAQRSQDGTHAGAAQIVITNYERLHEFDPTEFIGAVCDESSILKNFDGATKALVTEFMRRMPYRLLCTATAAPNDYIELGTSSEALGEMGYTDMLSMFFKNDEGSISPLSYETKWRFKPYAERPFWRWLCSWARALRKPSDLGYEDGPFLLPPLTVNLSTVNVSRPLDGWLFAVPATDLHEQRAERRATLTERCERVAALVEDHDYSMVWCHLNDEGNLLERLIPGSVQVAGSDPDHKKEEAALWFLNGTPQRHERRVLISKPRIFGFGLNFQHCAHVTFFPSHSYEQYYQGVRRCWRFGQTREVVVDLVTTAGEADVLGNLQRKADAADRMFAMMIEHMQDELHVQRREVSVDAPTLPTWMM